MRISDWSSDVCSSDLIAIDPSIGRRRRIGREVRPIAAVIAQIDLASLIEQPRRRIRLGAEAERPFRDAWQALKIGRASCRERVWQYGSISGVRVSLKKKIQQNKVGVERNKQQH